MKRNKIILTIATLIIVLSSCKDDFLEEKRDWTGVNEEVFKDPFMAKAYVDFVYQMFQPQDGAQAFIVNQTGVRGQFSDDFTQTTEELGGQSDWNRPWNSIAINQNHALQYFGERLQSGAQNNTWTRIRQINLFLDEIDKHGLPENTRNELKGQMLFWRAYQYFELLRLYGGVPLVLTAQNPGNFDGSNEIPRSTSLATVDQIVLDLDAAITMLPGRWPNAAADWGRITSGAAAAFKGRVLLTWASPLFNRTDDRGRWERAYNANKEAKTLLEANGFGLYKKGELANAEAWEQMFLDQSESNQEAVIVYNFNTTSTDQLQRNNGWESAVRPKEILGGGSISPTKQMLDAFPMKDGRMFQDQNDPTRQSSYAYDPNKFYKNRDPRFYKTFAYNGSLWPYGGNSAFRLWTYSWFTNGTAANPNRSTETLGANATGIYLRKATNPNASNQNNFEYSPTDFMELRFAEVVLNLAESAIGINSLAEGKNYIAEIRERAGVENLDGSFGLSWAISRDDHFAAVLNERKVEFAYEGKRFWDLRRWMLFYNHPEVNTVTRLKMQPLNDTRRTGIWIYVKTADGNKYIGDTDPLRNTAGNTPVVEREPAAYPPGISNFDQYLDYLYENHFEIIEKDNVDPNTSSTWKFTWYEPYYFFGLHQNALTTMPYLQQTKGWKDLSGQEGTFDPLN